jgi:hypothetical protein
MTETVETPAAPTTPEGAQARLGELTATKEFGERLMAGDVSTRAQFQSLSELAAGLEKLPGAEELTAIAEREADDRNNATFVKGVRESGLEIRDEVLNEVITGAKVSQEEFDAAKRWMVRHSSDAEWGKKVLNNDPEARKQLFLSSVILSSDIKDATT